MLKKKANTCWFYTFSSHTAPSSSMLTELFTKVTSVNYSPNLQSTLKSAKAEQT